MEVVKFQQAQLINSDLDMYYAQTDTPALCRTSSLVEELGQIEYIFSDKTGTLTRNEMEFRMCSIAGYAYAEGRGEDSKEGVRTFAEMREIVSGGDPFADPNLLGGGGGEGVGVGAQEREVVKEFLTLLAVCHTVIPEMKGEKMVYQASSPDEAALVAGAEILGYRFHVGPHPFAILPMVDLTVSHYKDPKAQIGIRPDPRSIARIRSSQCVRVQLDEKADEYRYSDAGWEDQVVL
jgi:phospholipid-transporting ATPase